ncbi:hypothetical protein HCN44_001370 [Aphidius gifuensis]|uniref:Cuticular protein n=1 Tax=Aphidius gifuensis TaxID=684658 RepID=A0A835CT84_APHGI|nr:uncharacterized protein LOC122853460 [Aphidius gifuensis]KAF7992045.1 hypothetical protein HCN44_001370 [Aphidius gifuensis]
MFKLACILAIIATIASAGYVAPLVSAPLVSAPLVPTSTSSQTIARNYNTFAAAPIVSAYSSHALPVVAASPYATYPYSAYSAYNAAPIVYRK